MRKKIVAGNWKMNLLYDEAQALADNVCNELEKIRTAAEVLFFPPAVFLPLVAARCKGLTGIHAGAQNVSQFDAGAYTGEIAAAQLRSAGATHVLIGHSERRAIFGEDEQVLAEKVKRALKHGLTPVFCCGELLPVREEGNHFELVERQITNALFDLDPEDFKKIIMAYEPVWAIGTGLTATPEQAQEMHAFIRKLVQDAFGNKMAEDLTILYGGSCNPKNAAELFSMPDVDGGLIGGASLKADDFIKIIHSF